MIENLISTRGHAPIGPVVGGGLMTRILQDLRRVKIKMETPDTPGIEYENLSDGDEYPHIRETKATANIVEAEITWTNTATIWWAFIWRLFVAVVMTTILLFAVNIFLGFIMSALDVSEAVSDMVGKILAVSFVLIVSIVPFRFMLNRDYGEIRLVIMDVEKSNRTPTTHQNSDQTTRTE